MDKGDIATSTTDADGSQSQPPPYQYPNTVGGMYPPTGPPPAYGAQTTAGYPLQGAYPQQPGAPVGQYYGQPQTIIQQQPGMVIVQQPMRASPPDYQALAWFACLCCCWPIGIVAILKSNEVRSAMARGDYNSAQIASRSARTFSMISIGTGVAFIILYLVLIFVWLIPLLAFSWHD